MKLDSELRYHHACPTPEHASKVIVHNDNHVILAKDGHFMTDTFKVNNEAKEESHGLMSPVEGKSFQNSGLSHPHRDISMEDSNDIRNNEGEWMEAPYSSHSFPSRLALKEDFYTDELFNKVERSQMVICIEDDASHIVKDTCVIEGVTSLAKILGKKYEADQKISCSTDQSPDDGRSDMSKKMDGTDNLPDCRFTSVDKDPATVDKDPTCVSEGVASLEIGLGKKDEADQKISCNADQPLDNRSNDMARKMGTDSLPDWRCTSVHKGSSTVDKDLQEPISAVDDDSAELCSSESSIKGDEKFDAAGLDLSSMSSKEACEKQLLPSQHHDTDISQGNSSSLDCDDDQKKIDRQELDQGTQGTLEEDNSTSKTAASAAIQSNKSIEAKEVPANCKVPSAVITFNFDSGAASISGREEHKEYTDGQKAEQIQTGTGTEEAVLEGAAGSFRGSFHHSTHGESNFSGPSLLSGPIATSGHIPYSGSISLRSDSSTTSARSFAFPILQSEWNSSPVKMAKADRRHLRKHRGWRVGLLCCRF